MCQTIIPQRPNRADRALCSRPSSYTGVTANTGLAKRRSPAFFVPAVMALITVITALTAFSTPSLAGEVLAPGYSLLEYPAPIPNSYSLPALGNAADGDVIDSSGEALRLHQLFDRRIVLLSFIYTTCDDINGCPLATAVLHKIKRKLEERPDLSSSLRMVTLSFDPVHDTPEAMQRYGEYFMNGSVDWKFITTRGDDMLQPILNSYSQTVAKVVTADGKDTGRFSHILRVFLIDPDKTVRNIYSTSLLHPDTVIADIETLQAAQRAQTLKPVAPATSSSLSPTNATRPQAPLYWATQPQLGLPLPPVPDANPLTEASVNLGRKLFFDRRLSLNDTVSCAMCHVPNQGFSNNEMATAVGIEGRTVRRNTPTLYNVAYLNRLFHDGREYSLEQQVWGPLLAANEMANPSVGYVVNKISALPDYAGLFETAFQTGPGMATIGMALASYQRTLNSADSAFDRWYFGNQADHRSATTAFSAAAIAGFDLFTGKGNCSSCHSIGNINNTRNPNEKYALFTDNQLHNTGIGYRAAMQNSPGKTRIEIAPGKFVNVDKQIIAAVSEAKHHDLGLYEITQSPQDRWKYRTPSLRNIALTAPYMHDGSLSTLRDVIEFYDQGGFPNENQDPRIRPLHLEPAEKHHLLAFLNALTGSNVAAQVANALASDIGDPD